MAPFDTADFDWFADMDAVNIEEIGWALEGDDVPRPRDRTNGGCVARTVCTQRGRPRP